MTRAATILEIVLSTRGRGARRRLRRRSRGWSWLSSNTWKASLLATWCWWIGLASLAFLSPSLYFVAGSLSALLAPGYPLLRSSCSSRLAALFTGRIVSRWAAERCRSAGATSFLTSFQIPSENFLLLRNKASLDIHFLPYLPSLF